MSEKVTKFINLCMGGNALLEEIDDFIDDWHEDPQGFDLHEYLGMTWEEYSMWVADPDILPYVIKSHIDNVPVQVLLDENYYELPLAARAGNAMTAKKIMAWLKAHGKIDA